jgi:hypothetical protein
VSERSSSLADQLRGAIEAAVEAEVGTGKNLADRVRHALDAWQLAERTAVESRIATRLGAVLPLAPIEAAGVEPARVELTAALGALDSWLSDGQLPASSGLAVAAVDADADADSDRSEAVLPSSPLTPEQLQAWASQPGAPERPLAEPSGVAGAVTLAFTTLDALLHRAGVPRDLDSDVAVLEELETLEALTSPAEVESWRALTREMQVPWLSLLTARARALKDSPRLDDAQRRRLRTLIVVMPTFAAGTRPGFVNGMRPAHTPRHGSWTADARGYQRELEALLAPVEPCAPRRSPPRAREGRRPPRVEANGTELGAGEVRDLRVVLFGGSPREDARASLERALAIRRLDWPESDKPRRVDALAARLRAGKIDVLVFNRFVHHAETATLIAAAEAGGTPFVMVDGYGLEAVRQAIDAATGARSKS